MHKKYIFRWDTHLCVSLFRSIRPSVHLAPFLRTRTWSNHNSWYTCVKWWYLQGFFSFFKNFDFLSCKSAKNSPKWKITITSVTRYISRTIHYIRPRFLGHLSKMMISSAKFLISHNFDFGVYEDKRAKDDLTLPISVCFALYIVKILIMILISKGLFLYLKKK